MVIDTIPLLIALVSAAIYTVLGGADFGAGLWLLLGGRGESGRRLREHAHRANAPVWEANHVWLVIELVVFWTAYPVVFGSVFSTLAIPLSVAAVGIILRGLTYALQSVTSSGRARTLIDAAYAIASILTPFMLGTVTAAIASGRVPVGNARGDLVSSWLNLFGVSCGVLAIAVGAFLAAVYLAADGRRFPERAELEHAYRTRALAAGVACGILALGALIVARRDVHHLYSGLTHGWGLAAVLVSAVAGVASISVVAAGQFVGARLLAAAAVAALIAGWAAAQRPYLLPGLTLREAASDHGTLVALTVCVAVGALILFPSLALLFRLTLSGSLDAGARTPLEAGHRASDARRPRRAAPTAGAFLVAGFILLTLADSGVAHAFGVVALAAASIAGYAAVTPDRLAFAEPPGHVEPPPAGPRS
jgi:cytochrome d ubiquinol oxidase subunit II